MSNSPKPLLTLRDVEKIFPIEKGFLKKRVGGVRAVGGVSLTVHRGETLGLVGESGCGKTTLGRCIVRAIAPTSGSILFQSENGEAVDLAAMDKRALYPFRREMQMIFQDPFSSLDARMTVLDIISEPLRVQGMKEERKIRGLAEEYAVKVGLNPSHLTRYPHAFSGGQRQRIGIARALITRPKFIVADEPVSALDVSIQAQILNLLQDIEQEMSLSFLFISHDLRVIHYVCDRVAVMYLGRVVELSPTEPIYDHPLHPYTEALFSAIPIPDPQARRERVMLPGEVGNPADPPSGCAFHPRCRYCIQRCREELPPLREIAPGRFCACHLAEALSLENAACSKA